MMQIYRTKSKEQRAKNKEQRTKRKEQRAKNKEQRTKNKEQRTKNKDSKIKPERSRHCEARFFIGTKQSIRTGRRLHEALCEGLPVRGDCFIPPEVGFAMTN